MSVLVIDAGNTKIKLSCWDQDVPLPDFRNNCFFPGKTGNIPENLGTIATSVVEKPSEFLDQIKALSENVDAQPILVSVIPGVDCLLRKIFSNLKVVDSKSSFPFVHEITEAHKVGPDRWCNIAAASASGLDSALVVDAGTATTFDLLLNGVFKGGLIAPGMVFAAEQLARQGAMLNKAPFEERPAEVGKNSADAMTAGSWLAGIGGIEWTIARLMETYGSLPVILTGGLGHHVANEERYLDQFWTLRGAAVLAETTDP